MKLCSRFFLVVLITLLIHEITFRISWLISRLGTYMDIGEECTVLSKVGSPNVLKDLEEFGVEFEAISDASKL